MRKYRIQKGSALLFSTLILSVILGIGLSVSTIVVRDIASARDVGLIMPSFPAADAGVERMLYRTRKDSSFSGAACQGTSGQDAICDASSTLSFSSDISYDAHIYEPGFGDPAVGTCPELTQNWCIFSTGTFQDFSRKIQVSF